LPLANSFRHQDLQGTLTPKPLPMPGTPEPPTAKAGGLKTPPRRGLEYRMSNFDYLNFEGRSQLIETR
jgi:hypothetical protein